MSEEKENWVTNSGGENRPMTKHEIEQRKAFIAEQKKTEWLINRLNEYPSIQELVVALYDESDKQSIIEKRAAVKAKYPKPD